MNDLVRWLLGRPTVTQVQDAIDNRWTGNQRWTGTPHMPWERAQEILDRERDFTDHEDNWLVETPRDESVQFYAKQLKITWKYRTRGVRGATIRASRYITKRYSDLVRSSVPLSTEVTRTWQKQHQRQKS